MEGDDPDSWQSYPVFYFDLNKKNYKADHALEEVLAAHLIDYEKIYGDENKACPLEERFQRILVSAVEQTGKEAVVLVDEYDKPLLEAADERMADHNKAVFKGFFSTLKSYDRYLKFVFLTGVTKFSKVSIFSDLNQLNDISLDRTYSEICGMTDDEITSCFEPEIEALATAKELGVEECLAMLKKMYDGYHFVPESVGLYNPFCLLKCFRDK